MANEFEFTDTQKGSVRETLLGAKAKSFDINELYKKAFGTAIIPYPAILADAIKNGEKPPFLDLESRLGLGTVKAVVGQFAKNEYGLAEFLPIKIKVNGFFGSTKIPGLYFEKSRRDTYMYLPLATASFRMKKKVVKSAPVGAQKIKGTVKEIVNLDDDYIRIRGMIIGENGEFPKDALSILKQVYNRNQSIQVFSELTSALGIHNVLFQELEIKEFKGTNEVVAYEMVGYSDGDPEDLSFEI